MINLEPLRDLIPEEAKDIRLNLQSVLESSSLSNEQRWAVAAASAIASRNARVREEILAAAHAVAGPTYIEDAVAAAALMAMNNVYYRFRHMIGKSTYGERPARLRMTRIAKPATDKVTFELLCLAVSAINGCEACIRSHEDVVLKGGLTEDQVHDAIRIAATIEATAVALEGSSSPRLQRDAV